MDGRGSTSNRRLQVRVLPGAPSTTSTLEAHCSRHLRLLSTTAAAAWVAGRWRQLPSARSTRSCAGRLTRRPAGAGFLPTRQLWPARPGSAQARSARPPEEVSGLLEAAYEADPDFAVLLWLAATTGARRGELCALRWGSVDLEAAELLILRNLFQAAGRLVEKDTKTHAARRLALSDDSVGLLEEHRRHCAERAEACSVRLSEDAYVFSFATTRQPN
jgi:integrase